MGKEFYFALRAGGCCMYPQLDRPVRFSPRFSRFGRNCRAVAGSGCRRTGRGDRLAADSSCQFRPDHNARRTAKR